MKLSITFLSVIISLFVPYETEASVALNTIDAFNKMKTLVGVWQKEGGNNPNFSISFELTANNSVLVETWLHKGKSHSLTVYHLNSGNLMATHYCPQGNQPRLELTKNSTIRNLSFDFLDATNLDSLADPHQHSLGFEFLNENHKVRRKESYLSKSGEDMSELILVKSK